MKLFNTFHKLYLEFKKNEVPFCVMQEMTSALLESGGFANKLPIDVNEDDVDALFESLEDIEENSFSWQLGGCVFICETKEDLLKIEGCDFEFAREHNRWPNVTDMPMSWDCCDYVLGDRETKYAVFLLCTNNAGGNIYYVPESLWEAARLTEHLETHNAYWS